MWERGQIQPVSLTTTTPQPTVNGQVWYLDSLLPNAGDRLLAVASSVPTSFLTDSRIQLFPEGNGITHNEIVENPGILSTVINLFATHSPLSRVNVPKVPNAVPTPASMALVASGIALSSEHYFDFVTDTYYRFLKRIPDPAGLNSWASALQRYEISNHQQGFPQEQVEAAFMSSAEYLGHFGGAKQAWIQGMYLDLFGRAGDASGVQQWTTLLSAGTSPAQIALGFTFSNEWLTDEVTQSYFALLGRAPDPNGQSSWLTALVTGTSVEEMNAAMLGSPECYNAVAGAAGNPAVWIAQG